MAMKSIPALGRSGRQSGLSLIFALLGLVAMTLGAVALVRSVDTSVLALGNLAFRQSGVALATRGAEDAKEWLEAGDKMNTGSQLDNDVVASGYYATAMTNLDATAAGIGAAVPLARVDWDDNNCMVNGQAEAFAACLQAGPVKKYGSDEVRYIITRLCPLAGSVNAAGNFCARPPLPSKVDGQNRGGAGGIGGPLEVGLQEHSPYFRIVVRTKGPRGTVSFTETLVHF